MILDADNSIIKTKTANKEIAFPHAMRSLIVGEYEKSSSRASVNGESADFLRVNGKPYVVGGITLLQSIESQKSQVFISNLAQLPILHQIPIKFSLSCLV